MTTQEQDLNTFIEFLKFASISTDPKHKSDVSNCCTWLCDFLKEMKFEVERFETEGHPIIVAKNNHKPNQKTVLLYGHYDVQPVDPLDLWDQDPFEPTVKGEKIFARGATDNKGQLLAHVLGVKHYIEKHGRLPVNLTFLFEGEEEIGSPNLLPFIKENKEMLKSDICIVSDTGMVQPGMGTLTYGLRGIACAEVFLEGPNSDLHSGVYGGVVRNTALEAAKLISILHDEEGHVRVPNFYEGVSEPKDWERESWKNLPDIAAKIKTITGVSGFHEEKGFSELERLWARPTAEINGIGSGYQGEGSKTVIPSKASFKVSFRLVPGQSTENVLNNFETFIQENCHPGVKCKVYKGHSGNAYFCDPNDAYGKATQKVLSEVFDSKPALIREGGSIPIIQDIKEELGLQTLLIGFALPDCNMHAPNESFLIENFYKCQLVNQKLLEEIAKV